MTNDDRQRVADWLAARLVRAEGSYVSASHVRAALYQDTGIFVTVTFLGHLVQARRAQAGGTLYLDHALVS